jgi:uncharacterized protein (UPF0303 family)
VRKNAAPSAYLGSVSSNHAFIARKDRVFTRIGIYAFATLIMVNATSDFEFFYEVFKHVPQPANRTYYESSVPK